MSRRFFFHIGIYMATWQCTLAKQVLRTWFEVSRQQSSKSDVILFLKQDAKFWQVIFDTNAQVKQIGRGEDKNRKREKESQKWKRGWEKKKKRGGGCRWIWTRKKRKREHKTRQYLVWITMLGGMPLLAERLKKQQQKTAFQWSSTVSPAPRIMTCVLRGQSVPATRASANQAVELLTL